MKSQTVLVKRSLAGVAAVAMAGALAAALMPQPVDADIAKVQRAALRVTVDEEGKTRIRDIYVVTAPIAGTLQRSALKAGDPVEKGETAVAIIKPAAPTMRDFRTSLELETQVKTCEANIQLADAELRQAMAEAKLAKSEFERATTLTAKGISTQTSLERAETNLKIRDAAVARAKAAVDVRKRELDSAKVRQLQPDQTETRQNASSTCGFDVKSPESGRVLKLVAESEQTLAAGAPILEIGNPANLEIVVDLLSADAVKVRAGSTATIDGWGGPPLNAHVTRIEPSGFTKVSALGIEEQRVKTLFAIDDPQRMWERLGHDYRVFVKINVFEALDALTVPLGALFRRGDAWHVFVVKDGRARVQPVAIGQRNNALAEVTGGLTTADTVILHPSDRIADGTRVRQRTIENAPSAQN